MYERREKNEEKTVIIVISLLLSLSHTLSFSLSLFPSHCFDIIRQLLFGKSLRLGRLRHRPEPSPLRPYQFSEALCGFSFTVSLPRTTQGCASGAGRGQRLSGGRHKGLPIGCLFHMTGALALTKPCAREERRGEDRREERGERKERGKGKGGVCGEERRAGALHSSQLICR